MLWKTKMIIDGGIGRSVTGPEGGSQQMREDLRARRV